MADNRSIDSVSRENFETQLSYICFTTNTSCFSNHDISDMPVP